MKHILAAVLLSLACAAGAQTTPPVPPVFPAQLGSAGSTFKAGAIPEGKWLAWAHTVNGERFIYVVCAQHDYMLTHPDTTGMTPIRAARAYWVANVGTNCRTDPAMRPMWLAAWRAMQE